MNVKSVFTKTFNPETCSKDFDDVLFEPPNCFELPESTKWSINCVGG